MAVVPETERRKYLQKFKWSISYTDGHVTTHKMLEFVNKRTDKDVVYKPTFSTMLKTFFGFIAVAALGAFVYIKLRFLWTNWVVWFAMSIVSLCLSSAHLHRLLLRSCLRYHPQRSIRGQGPEDRGNSHLL